MTRRYIAPEIADKVEESLPVEEFDRRVRAFTEEEAEEDETPPAPKPERKVPLKGGLGDRERNK